MAKLSKVQESILRKMRSGWELGCDSGMDEYCRMQKGGIGKGGKAETVNIKTLMALERGGFIKRGKWGYPTTKYTLV